MMDAGNIENCYVAGTVSQTVSSADDVPRPGRHQQQAYFSSG